MLTLAEIGQELSTATARLRGREVSLRALTERESGHLTRLFPRPRPPLKRDPKRGSLAADVPDEHDAGYQAELEAWFGRRRRLELVLALDLQPAGVSLLRDSEGVSKECLEAGEKELAGTLTEAEIARLWGRARDLLDEGAGERARASLIADLEDASLEGEAAEPFRLPERYGTTRTYWKLRVCERLGYRPEELEALDPGVVLLLLEHERVRCAEESGALDAAELGVAAPA